MRKATCTVVLAMVAAASMAAEQWGPRQARSAPALAPEVPAWVQAMWRPEQEWGAREEDEAVWAPGDTQHLPEAALDDSSLEGVEVPPPQDVSWLSKRQPPRRLGSLVDLYRSVAHGLSPFVAGTRNNILSAAPERRSGRRPAACRVRPFYLVCWNAARRSSVMRPRSPQ